MREGESTKKISCNYYQIYDWMPKKLKLKNNELNIYAIIYNYTISKNTKGYFNGSIAYLKEWTNASNRNVIDCLKNLLQKNLIILVADNSKHRKPNIYKTNLKMLDFLTSEESSQVKNNTSEESSQALVKKVHKTSEESSLNNKKKININKNIYAQSQIDADTTLSKSVDDDTSKQKKSPSNKKNDEIYIQRFDKFWEIYPKKKDKAKARQKWLKLKPDDELFNKIITAVKEQAQSDQWQKDDGQYIPYPSTWLNGERWNDEIKKTVHITPPPKEEEYKPVGNFKPIY